MSSKTRYPQIKASFYNRLAKIRECCRIWHPQIKASFCNLFAKINRRIETYTLRTKMILLVVTMLASVHVSIRITNDTSERPLIMALLAGISGYIIFRDREIWIWAAVMAISIHMGCMIGVYIGELLAVIAIIWGIKWLTKFYKKQKKAEMRKKLLQNEDERY